MPSSRKSQRRLNALKEGYRSAFEAEVARQAEEDGLEFQYEPKASVISYVETPRRYTPDFVLPNGVIVETKGRLTTKDRTKHLRIKEQYPELDIRFVFQFDNKLTRSSSTRYSEWCEKYGFKYSFKKIPPEWAEE
jgi:hypothetical protein